MAGLGSCPLLIHLDVGLVATVGGIRIGGAIVLRILGGVISGRRRSVSRRSWRS